MSVMSKRINFLIAVVFWSLSSDFLLTFTFARSASNCDCVCGARGRGNRIVGGNTVSPNEYPWLAGLHRQGKMYCGATLISDKHLITAAHCVYGTEPNEIRVYLGGHEIVKDYKEIRRIKKIHEHEYFDIISFDHDIAVLEMDKSVKFGPKVQPACLPDGSREDYTGALALVAGWGRTEERGKTSDVVRSVEIPVWSSEQCHEAGYGDKRLTANMMCGGYHDGGRDACQGDSGGPMILNGPTGSAELIGVVSWGRGCARPNLPGIYTRLVNYLPWIRKKLGNQCLCQPKVGTRSFFADTLFG